ncbi:MAG: dihydrofolate reductase [Novosphingobium sp.]|nr:dihydrofolate reductase [Novosphingobium sp.]
MARRIVGAAFLSLDNVMQAPGGPDEDPRDGFPYGGWMASMDEEAIGIQIENLFSQPFDLLLGRRTYEIFAAHWPYMPDEIPITRQFRDCTKYVLTGSDMTLDWEGSERLVDVDSLSALKAGDGPDIIIQGSTTLYPQLLARDLIDRLILIRLPVVIGQGRTMFGDGTPGRQFKPVETRVSPNGTVISTLEPAGEVGRSSFPVPALNERERERRSKIAGGTW